MKKSEIVRWLVDMGNEFKIPIRNIPQAVKTKGTPLRERAKAMEIDSDDFTPTLLERAKREPTGDLEVYLEGVRQHNASSPRKWIIEGNSEFDPSLNPKLRREWGWSNYQEESTEDGFQNTGAPPKPSKDSKVLVRNNIVQVTEGKKGGRRYSIYGFPVTAVLRWMGADAWDPQEVRKVMGKLQCPVEEDTIKAQLHAGRKGERGNPAALSDQQVQELYQLLEVEIV